MRLAARHLLKRGQEPKKAKTLHFFVDSLFSMVFEKSRAGACPLLDKIAIAGLDKQVVYADQTVA